MLACLITCAFLTVSGHAEHFDQGRYNEENYGIGIEYKDYSAGVLKDSNGNWSPYASYLWSFADYRDWDIGIAPTLAYRQDAPGENYAGLNLLPLPYARWTGKDVGLNIIVAPTEGGFIFFQLRIPLGG